MALKTIEEEWQGFSAMVFAGCDPSPTQRLEMKKAFFAGNWSLFSALEEIGCPHITEEQGEAFLTARKAECEAFKKQLLAEHAERN